MSSNPGNAKTKQSNDGRNKNSRGSCSMSDLSGEKPNSGRGRPFVHRGRGRGAGRGGNHGNFQGNSQQGNPPSYNEAMNYSGQNMGYGPTQMFPNQQMPSNQQMSPNPQMFGNYNPNLGFSQNVPMQGMQNMSPHMQASHIKPLFGLLPNPSGQQFNQQYQPSNQQYQPSNQQYQPYNQQYQPSNQQYQHSNQPQQQFRKPYNKPRHDHTHNKIPPVTSKDLIRELTSFSGFWTELDTLSKRVHKDTKETQDVINKYKGIFNTKRDESTGKLLVELSPKIKFCAEYMEDTGCHKERCFAVHTCQYNLFGSCSEKTCPFGHNLNTNHNSNIFKNFDLEDVSTNSLKDILKKMIKGSVYPKICVSYHQGECKAGKNCKELHICREHVTSLGNCPKGDDCSLNHNVHDVGCVKVFSRFNISTNESPRDLLKILVNNLKQVNDDSQWEMGSSKKYEERKEASTRQKNQKVMTLDECINSSESSDSSGDTSSLDSKTNKKKLSNIARKPKNDSQRTITKLQNLKIGEDSGSNDGQESDSDRSCSAASAKPKKKRRTAKAKKGSVNIQDEHQEKTKPSEPSTIFAANLKGNVASPFICIPFMYRKCDFKTGCKLLHTKNTFHWQFGDKNWFNFHFYHAKIIERHFRNISCDEFSLPVLDASKLDRSMKDMPCMLGKLPLKVDFTNMTLSGGAVKVPYQIRHITTPSSAVSNDKYSTMFQWYFKNDQDKWQLYEVSSKSVIASGDIEKAFLNAPTVAFFFQANNFVYELNFTNMTQINKSTGTVREIRRRPQDFPTNESSTVEKVSLPSNWDTSNVNKEYNHILLNDSSSEYAEVRQIVNLTLFCKIENIMRIQNEHLWRQFGNKKNQLKAKYKEEFLNAQKLFHCVDEQHFSDVCRENLDWRVHESSIHKQFGQGAYFFNSAATASKFATPDHLGVKKLLVFEVIIGYITKGDQSMTRPPENPNCNTLYDTTVDSETSPTTFVKYNKQEYYPSYVVHFK